MNMNLTQRTPALHGPVALSSRTLLAALLLFTVCRPGFTQSTSVGQRNVVTPEIQQAAARGDAAAQFKMGQLAERQKGPGNTIVGNYQVASEWYQKAAAQGHVKAMFALGDLYYYGKLGHNYPEAAKWFRKAAEKGDAEAVMRLGDLYAVNHKDLPADLTEAAKWYRVAADRGNAQAQYRLGCLLADRKDKPDRAEAERWLKRAAAGGYAEASVKLARLNQQSPTATLANVNREALEEASYRSGETRLLLGQAYEEGLGGPTNLLAATEVYWKILNQGPSKDRTEASRRLINLYAQKKPGFAKSAVFGPKDREAFAKLLQGNYIQTLMLPDSQYQVGEMFLRGDVLPEDKPQAVDWLTRAAKAGSARAMNRLGTLWAAGIGGKPDPQEAATWYGKAAALGFAEAQFNLGICYAKGDGVAADSAEAWCWLQLAAKQNFPGAARERDKIQAKLSSAQLSEARACASRMESSKSGEKPAGAAANKASTK